MCGICGFLNVRRMMVEVDRGRRMMELLPHRGPDGGGYLASPAEPASSEPTVFLGHLRLKTIDLTEAAGQPLPNA